MAQIFYFARYMIILFTFLSMSGVQLGAQDQDHAFAFVKNLTGKSALAESKNYKYQVARQVFDKLLKARGDVRQPAPALVMNNGEEYVAWMNPKKLQIGIEEKAYDICVSLGADSLDALAALLAHEMIHYFEKHDWNRHFAHQNKELETTRHIESLEEGIKHEAQADYLGGFLAYTAGFQVHDKMQTLLGLIYSQYGLPETIAGYPSLTDRMAISKNAMGRLNELQIVFETAALLSATGQYADAATYYQYILVDFPSREIYNNAGVNMLLAASHLFTPAELPYLLPIELDARSRLYGQKSVDPNRIETRLELLQEALRHFDNALLLDPQYSPAYLNKACALTMLSSFDDAEYMLRKGRKAKDQYKESGYLVLEGVIAAQQGDKSTATTFFKKATQLGSPLAELNLHILEGSSSTAVPPPPKSGVDRIDGILIDRFLADPRTDTEIDWGNGIFTYEKRYNASKIRIHSADLNRRYGFFQLCEEGCNDLSRYGTGRGNTLKDITTAHGPAGSILGLTEGEILVYPSQRLFFNIDQNQVVKSWGVYRLSDN